MQPLSEKAKGKQRADPIPEGALNHSNPPPPLELMVRFTDGVQDLVLHIAEHDSVRDVKAKVCSLPSLNPRLPPAFAFSHLFIPCNLSACPTFLFLFGKTKNHNKNRSGKRALKCSAAACASSMLVGSSPTVRSLCLGSARTKNASSAPRQKARTMPPTRHRYYPLQPVRQRRCHGCIVPSARQSPMARKRAKHRPRCVSFPPHPTTTHDPTNCARISPRTHDLYMYISMYVIQETQIKPLRGFDRLGAAGFSEDDILNFRRQFHSRSAADYLATAEFPTDEECTSPPRLF
jgi:DUF2407 C-terminal domain